MARREFHKGYQILDDVEYNCSVRLSLFQRILIDELYNKRP